MRNELKVKIRKIRKKKLVKLHVQCQEIKFYEVAFATLYELLHGFLYFDNVYTYFIQQVYCLC